MSLLVLILLLFGGLPTWGYHNYGYVPSGIGGILLLVVLVMFLSGRLKHLNLSCRGSRSGTCRWRRGEPMIKRAALLAVGAVMIAGPAFGDADCNYKGATYSQGSAVCQSGSQYRCDDGEWRGLAIACTESPATGPKSCAFNGSTYSAGSATCQSNNQYRCDDGAWVSLAVACTTSGQLAARVPPAGRTCMYNGATVGTDSTICKAGITFRCDDGEWRNLGTACQ